MLEADAVRWLPWFGLALVVALAGLRSSGRRSHRGAGAPPARSWCSSSPIAFVLVLASRNPKFNPRYLMLVSPAYLLLLAGGAAAWLRPGCEGGAHGLPSCLR